MIENTPFKVQTETLRIWITLLHPNSMTADLFISHYTDLCSKATWDGRTPARIYCARNRGKSGSSHSDRSKNGIWDIHSRHSSNKLEHPDHRNLYPGILTGKCRLQGLMKRFQQEYRRDIADENAGGNRSQSVPGRSIHFLVPVPPADNRIHWFLLEHCRFPPASGGRN